MQQDDDQICNATAVTKLLNQ